MPTTARARDTAAAQVFRGVTEAAIEAAARAQGIALDAAQRAAVPRMLRPARRHVYLHGPAGRGKTWLMDAAFAAAPTARKRRIHFHDFFPELHAAIFRHRHDLNAALDELLRSPDGDGHVELLCFDEFHVHDVADGVLIRRLLAALAARPVAMAVTSNYAPEQLLRHPLFHATFEPAIAEIRDRFDVIVVDGPRDHRAHASHDRGFAAGAWVTGAAPGRSGDGVVLRVAERDVTARALSEHELHATFDDLCSEPLSAREYAALARLRSQWLITAVPPLESLAAAPAQRLANLVDVAADRGVRVEFHAAGEPTALADAPHPPLDLARTLSRLGSLRRVVAS
ncbi:cell division protein ZapE [Microbacterium album]|uniref:Cell division protein ZapE n=1 Tax=Microbacterium album TaxID=2053191 RepID=A0A917IEF6_9MICO|nr:cell division protein ZapE [Microbacterium album]GGH40582.1 cell division protein ZapE [Microbacterium album]